jgi:post-segregation antitoxin (ccd killing protein)
MTTKTDNHAEEQAAAQYSSIVRMLAAVECDYDRLQELRDEKAERVSAILDAETPEEVEEQNQRMNEWKEENAEELAELEDAAGDCEDEDDARQRISEDPLSVEVRSDWTTPGEELEAAEFCILLCTGGPAVRIVGELNRGEPCRAWLEYQDWGTPWTQYFGASSDTLCQYAAHFFFGE